MKDKTFATLTGLFFLLFFAGIIAVALENPTTTLIRASNSNPSPLKSFAVVFPQVGVVENEAAGKGGTKIKVSVYIRDVNGTVLSNRTVQLSTESEQVTISPSDTQSTNAIGLAQFFVTSKNAGKVTFSVTDVASNTTVVNVPTVEFTE